MEGQNVDTYSLKETESVLRTLEMFWEQRTLQTPRGVKNKPGNRFKMRPPRDPWIDRQTNKRLS